MEEVRQATGVPVASVRLFKLGEQIQVRFRYQDITGEWRDHEALMTPAQMSAWLASYGLDSVVDKD